METCLISLKTVKKLHDTKVISKGKYKIITFVKLSYMLVLALDMPSKDEKSCI